VSEVKPRALLADDEPSEIGEYVVLVVALQIPERDQRRLVAVNGDRRR